MGVPPWLSQFLNPAFSLVLGLFLDYGILKADLTINAMIEGEKIPEFKKLARQAYEKATAKVYSVEEKNEIRKEYLALLDLVVPFGNGVR